MTSVSCTAANKSVSVPKRSRVDDYWLNTVSLWYTSVYPAKGRPGSGTTKLDSGAQMRLRRSRIEGYGPRPRPARDWPVPLSYHRPALRRARKLELQAIAHASVRRPWGVSRSRQFCTVFRIFTHQRSKFSGCFLSVHVYVWTYEPWNVSWKRAYMVLQRLWCLRVMALYINMCMIMIMIMKSVRTFLRNPEDRHTDRQTRQLYIIK